MFLQVSVCPQGGGLPARRPLREGGTPPGRQGDPQMEATPAGRPPGRETPWQGDSPTRETPLAGRPPAGRPPPTATAAGDKHPTGMHSCSFLLLQSIPDTDKFLLQGQPLYGQKEMTARDAYEQRIEKLRNLIDKYMTEENDEY